MSQTTLAARGSASSAPRASRRAASPLCATLSRILLGAGAVLTVTACSGPVEIETNDLDAEDRAACDAFVADLPDTLNDEARVEVEPAEDPLGAAYGDPPIVVTCGVDEPEGFGEGSSCEVANGVGWYLPDEAYDDQSLDLVLTAAGYRPRVEILVPAEYRPGGGAAAMAALAPLVEEHLTETADCL